MGGLSEGLSKLTAYYNTPRTLKIPNLAGTIVGQPWVSVIPYSQEDAHVRLISRPAEFRPPSVITA